MDNSTVDATHAGLPVSPTESSISTTAQEIPQHPQYGPTIIPSGWRQNRHQYSGDDFKVIDNDCIECPQGHRMDRQEVRYNRQGDMQMVFGVKPTICRACPVRKHCHAEHSTNTRGRRIVATRLKLPAPPPLAEQPQIIVAHNTAKHTAPGIHAIIWIDIPATGFRRSLKRNLEQNRVEIEPISTDSISTSQSPKLLTRHQRAHRRLNWEQRLKRNQLQGKAVNWKVQLFGISPALSQFIKQPLLKQPESS